MSVSCQINLSKPPDVAFAPGEVLSGVIKFTVHDPKYEIIKIRLRGVEILAITVENMLSNNTTTYTARKSYFNIEYVVRVEQFPIFVGGHEIPISYQIPDIVPSTLHCIKHLPQHTIISEIKYDIVVTFGRSNYIPITERFWKQFTVESGITPKLLMEPVIYGKNKILMRLFSRKNAAVRIKATIENSVIPPEGKIIVNYEIENDSNVVIESVETKLVEIFSFKAKGIKEVKSYEDVHETLSRSGSIGCDMIKDLSLELSIPTGRLSLENSRIVSRNYVVRIIAELPMPHRNVVLDIPVQIGRLPQETTPALGNVGESLTYSMTYDDPPPSYWEVMSETAKQSDVSDDN